MIYFSELLGKEVVTEDNVKVGNLADFIFLMAETPTISKIVVKDSVNHFLNIPTQFIKKINEQIKISKHYLTAELEPNEINLVKNLLDKQIIDLKGNKIVRVNDVVIHDRDGLYVAGVDIGVLGVLRWLKIEKILLNFLKIFNLKLTSRFLSWSDIQPLELVGGKVKLKKHEEKLKKIRPEDLADYLEQTNVANAEKILKILDQKQAAEVINNLNLNYQAAIFKHYHQDKAALILSLIEPDEACDILLTLPKKRQQQIIDYLPDKKKKAIEHLIKLAHTQIGQLLTTEYLSVDSDLLVSETITKIKQETADFYSLEYIYVVNKDNQLIGVFSLHELLIQTPDTPVYKFMIPNVIVAHITTPKEILLKKMLKYKLQALPIIDDNKRILGIVKFDDVMTKQ